MCLIVAVNDIQPNSSAGWPAGVQIRPVWLFVLSSGRPHKGTVWNFDGQGSMHRKCIPKDNQQDATLHSLFSSITALHVLGWFLHPSSGAQNRVYSNWYLSNSYCYLPLSLKSWNSRFQSLPR